MTGMTEEGSTGSIGDAGQQIARPAVSGLTVSGMSMPDLLAGMPSDRARKAVDLVDWLMRSDRRTASKSLIEELCERMIEAGLPLDRYASSTSMVTAEHDAVGRYWVRGEGVTETVYVQTEERAPEYLASPYYLAAQTQQWVEVWIPDTSDDRFGIVKSLRDRGITHYICVPILLTNGANAWVTFATRQQTGFSKLDLMTIAFWIPPLTTRIDARLGWSTLDKLLRTYVGDEPHRAILAGRAKRGQVSTIRAAMLVADLRDSTGHMAELSAVQAVDLFNDLFDCLVPPVEERRGEVLKYLGDGLLAVFRETKERSCDASDRALEAAEAALDAVDAFNRLHPDRRPMEIGIALHYGEVAYGNVGSGLRLDFTVIGRDVALASRIASMNAKLSQPLLLSAAFVNHMRRGAEQIGLFPARGFTEKVEIFRPGPRPLLGAAESMARDDDRQMTADHV
ncbi:adenylate/guanylate cyclase domain-containing protein [Lichenihabitans psoromatis]|uniref:adenylate/guanylate cyclase domain-containing protein n=1 Tax=Lichenihabitans psoromatis TaxID=2528642 RepID=UPI0010384528|nr:adenylate/guanylate cyclase domain-containing protein [Lichenihabitans psoromatis]